LKGLNIGLVENTEKLEKGEGEGNTVSGVGAQDLGHKQWSWKSCPFCFVL